MMLRIAEFATLAPSSHNSQPWRFKVADGTLEIFVDRGRGLPVVDPEDREMFISCGAAVEAAVVAMRGMDLEPEVCTAREGDADRVAVIRARRGEPSGNEAALMMMSLGKRHTNRGPFEPRPIPTEYLQEVLRQRSGPVWLHPLSEMREKHLVAELIAEGDRAQHGSAAFRRELSGWLRHNHENTGDGIPGYAHGLTGFVGDVLSVGNAWAVRTFDMGDGIAARDRMLAEGSPLLLVIGTRGDGREEWIETGRVLMRALLAAERREIRASFLNQPVEFPRLRVRLARQLGRDDEFPQLVLRMGFGPRSRPTPRRPVHEVMAK
jgi:hypothetical protein